jgi:zinc protease
MNLLLNVLVGGDSSRLHQRLVEKEQIAIDVGGFQMEGFDPGLVYFYLTLPPDGDIAAVERRVLEEFARVANEGISEAELEKARNLMIADYWRGVATIDGKASALGNAEVFYGDYERAFSLPDELGAITAARVKEVAAAVFNINRMTVGVLRSPNAEAQE